MPTFYIENLGCAKNQVDAEIMGAALEDDGWQWSETPEDASLILINTCAFVEEAQEESINTTLDTLSSFRDVPLVMTGCLSQRYSGEISEEMPELAGIFGNRDPQLITELVHRIFDGETKPIVSIPETPSSVSHIRRRRLLSHPGSAFVKIAEGCDHRCTFCAIPEIRGSLRTRPIEGIVGEIVKLLDRGIFEFNLVAQDLSAYDDPNLPTLLEAILALPGQFWIRPLYIYPDEFPLEVVRMSLRDSRLLPYFDIPFQHASAPLIKRMGRRGSGAEYLALLDRIRSINPDAVIRSSFIVGFPGETERDVDELVEFLKTGRLDWAGFFRYSPQDGTPAMKWVDEGVLSDSETVSARLARVQQVQESVTTESLTRFTETNQTVLIEEVVEGADMYLGRSPVQAPEVDGLVIVHSNRIFQPGDRVSVRIRNVRGVDMNADTSG